ncbi:GTP binding protein [Thoreauomyces humboldtii]|nr:GTP binding protein [Thoreauomyces humboldtii]
MFRRNEASSTQLSSSRESFMDREVSGLCLPPEIEQGNVEYKLQLIDTPPDRLEHLITQLKWRLAEGFGEAMYEIGVSDKGTLVGLSDRDLHASIATLRKMGAALSADVSIVRERVVTTEDHQGPVRKVAEILVRRCLTDDQHFLEVRVAIVGGADAGKSTLLGVLTHGERDNGRGKARLNLLRHRHEIESGRTSSISHQILGFDPAGTPINYASNNIQTWAQICETASKIITFLDMCGHPKYQNTTLSGLTGHAPDHACLIIGANAGRVPDVSREHLGLAVSLQVPVFVVITKIDIASSQQLTRTVGALLALFKSPGIRHVPLVVQNQDDVVVSASAFVSSAVIPVFLTSSVTGENMPLLVSFLNLLPKHPKEHDLLVDEDVEYQIEEVYDVPDVGTVVGGKLLSGRVRLSNRGHGADSSMTTTTTTTGRTATTATRSTSTHRLPLPSSLGDGEGPPSSSKDQPFQPSQTFYVGPDRGAFLPIVVTSIQRNRCPVNVLKAGQAASFAISFLPGHDAAAAAAADDPTTDVGFRLRKGQLILPYVPVPVWEFTARLNVLHAAVPLAPNTPAVVYIHSVRQAVRILDVVGSSTSHDDDDDGGGGQASRKDGTGTGVVVRFRFLGEAECVSVGRDVVVRGVGNLKCVGKVVAVKAGEASEGR